MEKKKILIVEDEPEMRAMLVLELETSGYEVFQAENGEAGFQAAKDVKPDLIVSDVLMPKMDGSKFLKELRRTDFGRRIPFIVLTARGKMKDYFEAVEADDFIEKPFSPEELLARIDKVVRKAKVLPPGRKKDAPGPKLRPEAVASSDIPQETELVLDNRMIDDARSAPAPDIKPAPRPRAQKEKIFGKKKVLILDKDPAICIEFQKECSSRGYATSAAFTPDKCLTEAMNFRPNVVVLKKFTQEAGLEKFIMDLRGITGTTHLPVIVYESVGQKVTGPGTAARESGIFHLSEEGQQIIQKIEDLLEE